MNSLKKATVLKTYLELVLIGDGKTAGTMIVMMEELRTDP